MLTVAYILAGGRTASEIKEHLKIPLLSRKELFEGFHNIYGMFEDHNHSSEIIESVSAAFVGGGLNAPQRIQKNLQQNLNTFVDHTTITNSYDSADRNATTSTSVTPEEAINDFVIKKTRGLIGELITPGTIQANQTALWLFNVLYFQGTWQHKFNPRMTHPAEFKVDGKHPVKVPTMMVKAEIPRNHFPDLEMTVLELPYGHDGLYSLFLLLPDKDDGLPELERRLKHLRLQNVLSSQHWARLTKVFLPKFKFEKETDLMEAMRRLGFKKMFQPGDAYFSRLTGQCNDSAYVTKIEHKAVIEVNEDGTRAAAATARDISVSL
nr:hypothetical protein BaRGS_014363 [Batillaria attramentaria]